MSIQKCSSDTVQTNAVINSFIEGKKLKLSNKKCYRIHVQNKRIKHTPNCKELKIHDDPMKDAVQEKYLGDLINTTGTIRNTVEDRKNKGFGIVNERIALLDDIPLGRYKLEIGLKLRQAMLLNGILYNSEALHSLSEAEIKTMETVDEHLLRSLVQGHAKTPIEFLYLEAGAIPIRMIIASRRLMYHQTILKREEKELTKRIYKEQTINPTPGDFVKLLEEDFKLIGEKQNDIQIQNTNCTVYKKFVKKKIKEAAFKYLQDIQKKHSKVSHIEYQSLELQKYMTNAIFSNEEVKLLHALRSRTTDCKENFKQKYLSSNLLCPLCNAENESQQHLLTCKAILSKLKTEEITKEEVKYEHLFSSNVSKQKVITVVYTQLFEVREKLKQHQNCQPAPSPTSHVELRMSDNLLDCIVCSSVGKKIIIIRVTTWHSIKSPV